LTDLDPEVFLPTLISAQHGSERSTGMKPFTALPRSVLFPTEINDLALNAKEWLDGPEERVDVRDALGRSVRVQIEKLEHKTLGLLWSRFIAARLPLNKGQLE
jgi:hypothetical protein